MFLIIKLYLHLNTVLMLNRIIRYRSIFIKMDLALNNLQRLICHKTQPTNQPAIQRTIFFFHLLTYLVYFQFFQRLLFSFFLSFFLSFFTFSSFFFLFKKERKNELAFFLSLTIYFPSFSFSLLFLCFYSMFFLSFFLSFFHSLPPTHNTYLLDTTGCEFRLHNYIFTLPISNLIQEIRNTFDIGKYWIQLLITPLTRGET